MAQANRTTSFIRLFAAGSTAALALGIATPSFAQDAQAQADQAPTTGEIVVTAQFREQRLQDTPLSITAVDASLLASRNQTDISQIAAQAPNVQLTQMGGAFGSSMAAYIRGIGQYDFNPAYEPGVGIYVDDVYYATLTGSVMDLLDLDRVEVLRGPQGTLTGRNSIGGAIKLFSAKPTEGNSGTVEATYGSRQRVDLRATANFELTDGLYARISGVFKRQDGYVDQIDYGCANPDNELGIGGNASTPADCVVAKLGEKNYSGIRGSLRYNPSDTIDWIVTGDYTYENRTNAAGVMSATDPSKTGGVDFTCGKFCTYASWYMPEGGQATQAYYNPNTTKFEGWGVSSNLTVGISDSLKLQAITAYRKYNQIFGTDDDYTPYSLIGGSGFNDLDFKFFSQELRLNGQVGDNIDWTIGGFYNNQTSVYFTRQDIRYIVPIGVPSLFLQFQGNDPIKANSKAAFGTVIFHPTEAMTVTGGIRYTKEHKDYTFVRQAWDGGTLTDPFGVGALDGSKAVYDGDKVDWRLSLDYRFSPEVLAYATVSTGFKGGGVTARPFTKNQAINGTFDPETLHAYEVGLKTDLFDRRLRLNLSGFYNDYKNIQLPIGDCSALDGFEPGTDPFPCAAIQNAGDGEMYGLEAELSAHPVEGLDIDASLSWIDGKWKRIDTAAQGALRVTDPITTPAWRGSFGIQYKALLGNNAGSITPRFDLSYTGKQTIGRLINSGEFGPLQYNPSITLANARVTWKNEDENLAVSFEVQNLFDKYYYLPLRFAAVYAFVGTAYSNVGRPREWAVTVQKKF
ncbi:TonB-dependent receptor [Novosphingobium aromaticivorans DSM 12444]|uniref:TonB-dependent receptor n=1 Tax=Novosphingobium aromaticivorans (strain ATCC 700278 / DSM 12444 / CCUG 56034 / CIP 105152 / NBRC 16084 / F199) TaxID=279238 RepID=Q2G4I4_NOVAD|nr:TonB-dependent receptor [Novosphingobium aromaticivorans]ABD27239.1 TonB-dependent receptor [Novosphingobium aromaticivorans DSM 12444]SCY93911.1 iron complex outermembrane recepter protein [Novosphingobium aromaticivorans]